MINKFSPPPLREGSSVHQIKDRRGQQFGDFLITGHSHSVPRKRGHESIQFWHVLNAKTQEHMVVSFDAIKVTTRIHKRETSQQKPNEINHDTE